MSPPTLPACPVQEMNYAFVEFRSVEEASNAMAFDGVAFKNTYLKASTLRTHAVLLELYMLQSVPSTLRHQAVFHMLAASAPPSPSALSTHCQVQCLYQVWFGSWLVQTTCLISLIRC